MDWTQIIIATISALTGGVLASVFTYKLGNRKQNESEFSTLVKEYKEMVDNYKVEVMELRKDLAEVRIILYEREMEVKDLKNQLIIFESSNADAPIPMWLKNTEGKMLYLNSEYERLILQPIGKSSQDYIGNTDVEVWGEEIGKVFDEHDKKVIRAKKPIEFLEQWEGQNGVIYEGKVIKYPRFLNNRTVIGIGGIIIETYKLKDKE